MNEDSTKGAESASDNVITSDNPYGSHHKKTARFKLSSFLVKRSQLFIALVVVVLVAGIGTYFLVSSHAATTYGPITGIGSKCLDNAGNKLVDYNKIELYKCNSTNAQQWTYNLASNGTGTITNINGYCLDVDGAGTSSMTLVDLYQCNSTVAQVWEVNSTTGTIINPHSGLCLDDKAASTINGNQIWIYTCNGTAAQKWVVSSSSATTPAAPTGTAPAITSTGSTSFTEGTAGSFTVTDTGIPVPTLSESGTLPSGISFNATSDVLSGTASTTGAYPITFTASNGVSPNAVQSFVLTAASVPASPPSSGSGSSSESDIVGVPAGLTPGSAYEGLFETMTSAQQSTVISQMKSAGVSWIRIDINIAYPWSYLTLIQDAAAAGIKVDALLDDASTPTPTAFAAFATQAVAKLAPLGVSTYEVMNEPNCAGVSASAYTAILRSTYTAIKTADSSAFVLSAGLCPAPSSYEPYTYLTAMYAAGAHGYFDAMNMHPYSYPDTPLQTSDAWNPWSYLSQLRSIMNANGDSSKQIWLTEFGCPTGTAGGYPADCTDATLAQQITDAFSSARTEGGIGPLLVYSWQDDPTDNDGDFGLYNSNATPKPDSLAAYTKAADSN